MVLVLSVAWAVGGLAVAGSLARVAWRDPTRARLRRDRPQTRWALPAPIRSRLGRVLADAPIALTPEDAVLGMLVAVLVAVALASALSPVLALPAALVTLAAGPVALVLARGRAQRRFVAALPGFVDLVAARLRSGHTVATALADAAGTEDAVAPDLERLLRRVVLGEPLETALSWWADTRELDAVRAVAGSLAVAAATGGAAADALEGLARSLRDQLGARAEAAALSAQARLSAVVVGVAPIAYVAFAAAVDPASAAILVSSPVGRVCLVTGIALDLLGVQWMRRIVRSEP
ncbi:MAG: type II secretion system F family protein [Actinomycetota bacterium]